MELERSIGRADDAALRNMILDAEGQLLGLEKDVLGLMEEMRQLREAREPRIEIPAAVAYANRQFREKRREREAEVELTANRAYAM